MFLHLTRCQLVQENVSLFRLPSLNASNKIEVKEDIKKAVFLNYCIVEYKCIPHGLLFLSYSMLQFLRTHRTETVLATEYKVKTSVMVDVKYFSYYNPAFYFQHSLTHVPFRIWIAEPRRWLSSRFDKTLCFRRLLWSWILVWQRKNQRRIAMWR